MKENGDKKDGEAQKMAEKLSKSGLEDFILYLTNPWRIIWSNFLAGAFRGVGFVFGATILLTLITYILVTVLGNLPWVGEWFKDLGGFIQDIQKASQNLQKPGS